MTTSANQEDHVSMGLAAARKARRSVACLQKVLATELMCAAQGIEFRRPLRSSDPIEKAHARIRLDVPKLEGDRVLGPDLDALTDLIRSGELAGIGAEEDT